MHYGTVLGDANKKRHTPVFEVNDAVVFPCMHSVVFLMYSLIHIVCCVGRVEIQIEI